LGIVLEVVRPVLAVGLVLAGVKVDDCTSLIRVVPLPLVVSVSQQATNYHRLLKEHRRSDELCNNIDNAW